MGIDGEKIVHRGDGLAEVATQQLGQYEVECFVLYHTSHYFTFESHCFAVVTSFSRGT